MANTSSAKKAIRVSLRKKIVNDKHKTEYKNSIKNYEKALASNAENTLKLLSKCYKEIDKAAKKSIAAISKSKASRLKSQLAKKLV